MNPNAGYKARQNALEAWGFGSCRCKRCMEEVKTYKETDEAVELNDMERELKAGLGVM